MRIGVVFPTTEIGADAGGVRDYIETAEGLGFKHIVAFDHVLGAGLGGRPDWKGPYSSRNPFHEPFVLFGFIAALTKHIEMATGVLIMPQRQTALVAKQAAEIDVLSKGRLRLGLGVGWNPVEYQALGKDFHNRGRRLDEQVDLLRQLWGNDLVTFNGKYEQIPDAGINPLPVNRNIPVWFGGNADAMLRRTAKMGDGWFPIFTPSERGAGYIEQMKQYLREANRGFSDFGPQFGMDPILHAGSGYVRLINQLPAEVTGITAGSPAAAKAAAQQESLSGPQEWAREAEWWKGQGATHLSLNTMGADLQGAKPHIAAIRQFAAAMAREL